MTEVRIFEHSLAFFADSQVKTEKFQETRQHRNCGKGVVYHSFKKVVEGFEK